MAIPKFDVDMDIIAKLGDYPGSDNNLTPDGFRKKFDLAGKFLKEYINTILLPHLNQLVDVESLLNGILDPTLTQEDKAAPAKYVGDTLRNLGAQFSINQAIYFEKVVRSGDYVLSSDQQFMASLISTNVIRVYGGEAVSQGHVMPVNIGRYVDVEITQGIYGTYRNDLVCLRFQRDDDGNETCNIVVIEGTLHQTGGVDPEYYTDNINVIGAATYDFPLYRVKVTGVDITMEPLFTIQKSLADSVFDSVINKLSIWEGGSY